MDLLSIDQFLCWIQFFLEVTVSNGWVINQVNFPPQKSFQLIDEVKKMLEHVGYLLIVEINSQINIALIIEFGSKYYSDYSWYNACNIVIILIAMAEAVRLKRSMNIGWELHWT